LLFGIIIRLNQVSKLEKTLQLIHADRLLTEINLNKEVRQEKKEQKIMMIKMMTQGIITYSSGNC
jgi:hypothetical protein